MKKGIIFGIVVLLLMVLFVLVYQRVFVSQVLRFDLDFEHGKIADVALVSETGALLSMIRSFSGNNNPNSLTINDENFSQKRVVSPVLITIFVTDKVQPFGQLASFVDGKQITYASYGLEYDQLSNSLKLLLYVDVDMQNRDKEKTSKMLTSILRSAFYQLLTNGPSTSFLTQDETFFSKVKELGNVNYFSVEMK